MKINILEQAVYNRISAGEVVENPASVVKELVENSIDAGATQIGIYILQGGIKSIEITDDGCGIEKEELYKTVLPHATSKIVLAEDLDSIATLGFRGEALASIAAVSEIEIKSRYFEADYGAKLTAKGGENVIITDTAYNQGTSIIINNLFYNTPARFKFLKGVKTEEGYVTKAVSQLILANPNIAIKYYVDGKQIYNSDGSGIKGAAEAVFSMDINSKLLPIISDSNKPIRVSGLISTPSLYKNNRNLQTLILNGRVVTDQSVSATVNSAYGGRLMTHNFPVFVINIIMPFDDVDVNVHPNKREVRFANPRQVYGAIYHAVKNTLEEYEAAQHTTLESKKEVLAAVDNPVKVQKNETEELIFSKEAPITPVHMSNTTFKPDNDLLSVAYYLNKLEQEESQSGVIKVADNIDFPKFSGILLQKDTIGDAKTNKSISSAITFNSDSYKIVGQIFDTYVALEYQNELYIIDQHAVHEKLLYDKLKTQTDTGEVASQPLMVPYIYEDSPAKIAEILELAPEINRLGFEIEQFGNNTVKINAVPQSLTDIDPAHFLAEIADGIQCRDFSQSDITREKLLQKACKSAIKGGFSYSSEQLNRVIKYFFESGMPLHCPHGRPTYITFTKTELEKLFRRKL